MTQDEIKAQINIIDIFLDELVTLTPEISDDVFELINNRAIGLKFRIGENIARTPSINKLQEQSSDATQDEI